MAIAAETHGKTYAGVQCFTMETLKATINWSLWAQRENAVYIKGW